MWSSVVALALLNAVLPVSAGYTSKDKVVVLTESNFEEEVLESDKLWIVEFYAPWCGHCKALEPEWKKAAKEVADEPDIKFGAVDATEHGSLGSKYGVRGYPTIKVFGFNKKSPKDYRSGRTSSDLVAEARKQLKVMEAEARGEKPKADSHYGDDVTMLGADDFDEFMSSAKVPVLVKFMAPWCGHCKNMIPAFSAAATALKGTALLAAVDATQEQELTQRFEVGGFPTLKVFLPGESDPVEYNGGRSEDAIIEFMTEKAEESGGSAVGGVFQITDPEEFKTRCQDKTICVIAALPHLIDGGAARRNKYLEVLTEIAGRHKKGYGFAWYSAGEQNGLDEALGVTMYPTLEAVNFAKGRHTRHVLAFDTAHISTWVSRPGPSSPLQNSSPKVRARDEWDGGDYVPPADE